MVLLGCTSRELVSLADRLRSLSTDEAINLSEHFDVRSVDDIAPQIRFGSQDRIARRGGAGFVWELTRDALAEAVDKVDELSRTDGGGHQYFSESCADDAVIMISIGEYDSTWWSRASTQARNREPK